MREIVSDNRECSRSSIRDVSIDSTSQREVSFEADGRGGVDDAVAIPIPSYEGQDQKFSEVQGSSEPSQYLFLLTKVKTS